MGVLQPTTPHVSLQLLSFEVLVSWPSQAIHVNVWLPVLVPAASAS